MLYRTPLLILSAFAISAVQLAGCSSTAEVNAEAEPVKVDLLAHWKFDAEGTAVADASGLENHGELGHHGGGGDHPVWSDGRVGGGLTFDGVDDFVYGGTAPSILGTGGFTVAAWVKTSVAGEQVIIQQRGEVHNGQYILQTKPSGKLGFWTMGGSTWGPSVESKHIISDGTWHHVAGIRDDDGTTKIYVDGELSGAVAGEPRPLVETTIYIGADMRDYARFFKGSVDDVRIHNRALSGAEVRDLFLAAEPLVPDTSSSISQDAVETEDALDTEDAGEQPSDG